MKRIVGVAVLAALIVGILAPMVFAEDTSVNDEIQAIYRQMLELRKKLVDLYVENGTLTPEQGAYMKDNMDRIQESGFAGHPCGGMGGFGMMGPGYMMGGYGSGPALQYGPAF